MALNVATAAMTDKINASQPSNVKEQQKVETDVKTTLQFVVDTVTNIVKTNCTFCLRQLRINKSITVQGSKYGFATK